MLKFDWDTKTNYLICDCCKYPFLPNEDSDHLLSKKIAEDGVIEGGLVFCINGKHLCLDCMKDEYESTVDIEIKEELLKQKMGKDYKPLKERFDERQRKDREHNETDSR